MLFYGYSDTLGGGRYIHLTTEASWVFGEVSLTWDIIAYSRENSNEKIDFSRLQVYNERDEKRYFSSISHSFRLAFRHTLGSDQHLHPSLVRGGAFRHADLLRALVDRGARIPCGGARVFSRAYAHSSPRYLDLRGHGRGQRGAL